MAVFVWVVKYQPFAASPRLFDGDARQHVYWTYTFRDAALFRHDWLTDFISSAKVAPLGYKALYYVGTRLLDPLWFSQLLSLLLVGLSLPLIYRIGEDLGGSRGGLMAGCLLVVFYFMSNASGGFPRSFALPLLLGCVSLLRRRAFGRLTLLLPLQSLLYPPILLNSVALAAAVWFRDWNRRPGTQSWHQALVLCLGVGLAGGTLLNVYSFSPRTSFGHIVSRHEAREMPEFAAQGRSKFFDRTLLLTLLNRRAGIAAESLAWLAALLVIMFLIRWPAGVLIPSLATDMAATSLGLFGLAHLVLFKLHLPARYVMYTFPLAAILVLAANIEPAVAAAGKRWPACDHGARHLYRHPGIRWGTLGLVALVFFYAQNRYTIMSVRQVDSDALHLYRYLQTLPKDVLIAGHPEEMDNIPLFARRKVLVNQELSLPYFTGYYAQVRQRLFAMLAAYYATDIQDIQRFVQSYSVDYILVNTQHFDTLFLQGTIYDEPFGSFVRQRLDIHKRFALLDAPILQRVYERGPYVLISFIDRKKGEHGTSAD
jgi:hypothetical protein